MDVSTLTPLIEYAKGVFVNMQTFALQFGGLISPQRPEIGTFIILLFAIMLMKGKFENILTYVLVAVLLALLLGIKLG